MNLLHGSAMVKYWTSPWVSLCTLMNHRSRSSAPKSKENLVLSLFWLIIVMSKMFMSVPFLQRMKASDTLSCSGTEETTNCGHSQSSSKSTGFLAISYQIPLSPRRFIDSGTAFRDTGKIEGFWQNGSSSLMFGLTGSANGKSPFLAFVRGAITSIAITNVANRLSLSFIECNYIIHDFEFKYRFFRYILQDIQKKEKLISKISWNAMLN